MPCRDEDGKRDTLSAKKGCRTRFPQVMHQTIHIFGHKVVDKWVAIRVPIQVHLFYQHLSHCLLAGISTRYSEVVFRRKAEE
jgi:hypothetical protein